MSRTTEYDLFVSYAHTDNQGEHEGLVSALVEAIRMEYRRMTSTPLRVFFDVKEIRSMDDWEHRIYAGLRSCKVMLAVLSPAYFESQYCRKEWERYIAHELEYALPGEGIAPIYTIPHPGFDDYKTRSNLDTWLEDLKRRKYVDLRPWWPEGMLALEREDVRRRIAALEDQIQERLERGKRRDESPTTVPPHNSRFVGRQDELRQLREALAKGHIGAITALHGIGGIGKSALAFEYAHCYGDEYPGGRFLIPAAGLTRDLGVLHDAIINLAPQRGIELSEEERKDRAYAYQKVRAAFEQGPRCLLLLDNVDDPGIIAPDIRSQWLPTSERVHVLVTTRLDVESNADVCAVSLTPCRRNTRCDFLASIAPCRMSRTTQSGRLPLPSSIV